MALSATRLYPRDRTARTALGVAVCLAGLWILEATGQSPGSVTHLAVATLGTALSWSILRRGLEPAFLTLSVRESTLHCLLAVATLLLGAVQLALWSTGRLPGAALDRSVAPFWDHTPALLALLCACANASRFRTTPTAAHFRRWSLLALLAAAASAALWLALSGDRRAAAGAAVAVILAWDPDVANRAWIGCLRRGIERLVRSGWSPAAARRLLELPPVDVVLIERAAILVPSRPLVHEVVPLSADRGVEDILRLAAAAEFGVRHPIRDAILEGQDFSRGTIPSVKGFGHTPGQGVRAVLLGKQLLCGNRRYLRSQGWSEEALREVDAVAGPMRARGDTVLHVVLDDVVQGLIALQHETQPRVRAAIEEMRRGGTEVGILSDDDADSVKGWSRTLGDIAVHTGSGSNESHELVRAMCAQGLRVAVVSSGEGHLSAAAVANVAVRWPLDVDAGSRAGPEGPASHLEPQKPELDSLTTWITCQRDIRQRWARASARLASLQLAACALAAGAHHPWTGLGPSPLLATALFFLCRRVEGPGAGSPLARADGDPRAASSVVQTGR